MNVRVASAKVRCGPMRPFAHVLDSRVVPKVTRYKNMEIFDFSQVLRMQNEWARVSSVTRFKFNRNCCINQEVDGRAGHWPCILAGIPFRRKPNFSVQRWARKPSGSGPWMRGRSAKDWTRPDKRWFETWSGAESLPWRRGCIPYSRTWSHATGCHTRTKRFDLIE